jgi:hypothetical protein
MYAFAPEKPPGLVGRNFGLAILRVFAKASNVVCQKSVGKGREWIFANFVKSRRRNRSMESRMKI